ncbi:sphingomyelin phosphodiesterase-like [Oppia nitens]|uniref:sphingomyelin phosphodiesterase-like n=1 Tax=Oppia nitens TaxID=1686743 RepID=UPI0023DC6448|nr:sphingomyelin phosphodiesterase-like [Oppia nitens]
MACKAGVAVISNTWVPMRFIRELAIMVCQLFQPLDVCSAFADLFQEPSEYIRYNTDLNSDEMCAVFLGDYCLSATDPSKSPNVYWRLTIPPPKPPVNISRSTGATTTTTSTTTTTTGADDNDNDDDSDTINTNTRINKILHITDIHLDREYRPLTTADCGRPYCCRTLNQSLVDQPDRLDSELWGSYRCDPPVRLVQNLFDTIDWPSMDWIYWTGDVTPHNTWQDTREGSVETSRLLTDMFAKYTVGSQAQVVPVIGNHISIPVGFFAPDNIEDSRLSSRDLYNELAQQWQQWLPNSALKTLKIGGYYALAIRPGLRILVLNTNYCSRLNLWVYYRSVDTGDQLKWLIKELDRAERVGDRVHLVGHIPPDNAQCTQSWLYNFMAIVERYTETITGQFYGHTHYDEFRVYYANGNSSRPTGAAFIGPSVSPYVHSKHLMINPAYRVIKCMDNGTITDMDTYNMNLIEANRNADDTTTPDWPFRYSMASEYKLRGFTGQDMDGLIRKMKRNYRSNNQTDKDNPYVKRFYGHYTRAARADNTNTCDQTCRQQLLADMVTDNAFQSMPDFIADIV